VRRSRAPGLEEVRGGCSRFFRSDPPRRLCRWSAASRRLVDLVDVPFEKVPVRAVGPAAWKRDALPGVGIEVFAVAEFVAEARTDQEPMLGVNGEVTPVVERVYVRTEQ